MNHDNMNRRGFLRRSGALSAGALTVPWAMNLAGLAEAAAAQADQTDDYKALVCVFLQGGNDQGNTIVPVDDAGYQLYARLRGGLALPLSQMAQSHLTPSTSAGLNGRQLALAPGLSTLSRLFNDDKRLAVLLNIGPLVEPTSRAQFRSRSVGLPPKLFSHNDQQSVWQSYSAEGATLGWGGLIGDAGLARNAAASLTCVNLSGNTVFVAGAQAGQFMVNPHGPDALLAKAAANVFGSQACTNAFLKLAQTEEPSVHRLAKEHSAIMSRAIVTNELLRAQLDQVSTPAALAPGGSNPLAYQLNTAARIIAAHQSLGANGGVKRQVFFVSLGGFDMHDNLSTQHQDLLTKLGDALLQFDTDLFNLGMSKQVTTFTASDFGRTLSSNGDGSDHGWGSHHLVMGGAVQGGRFYGEWPDVSDHEAGAHNIGQGRLLPTMSVDHLAVSLAGWMGVTDPAALKQIAPHLANFPGASPLANLF
ncbi:MAG TPA: DUF1501 domain-containing protein [Aquabacterium sp.]|uniref:DUF1501 domain-containing protein n=1 Tax=Aquabacterium sp. TaxID=1872578 RepID=UPI002E369619|nr:DUF1501 domain-containing protein [Aquabacterium sp.]HEX5356334.1 DUF1501 domain-containing protein [Aquabacterium sp.]